MESLAVNDFQNDDWKITHISSLYLKKSIIYNNTINDDDDDVSDDIYSSEAANEDRQKRSEIHSYKKQIIDDRFVTTRTKERMNRIVNTNSKDAEILYEEVRSLKSVVILGDSTLNNINPRGISEGGNAKVSNYPRSTSEDMKDFINPTIRRRPDMMILHVGTNDINTDIDTLSNLQTIVARIKKSYLLIINQTG